MGLEDAGVVGGWGVEGGVKSAWCTDMGARLQLPRYDIWFALNEGKIMERSILPWALPAGTSTYIVVNKALPSYPSEKKREKDLKADS